MIDSGEVSQLADIREEFSCRVQTIQTRFGVGHCGMTLLEFARFDIDRFGPIVSTLFCDWWEDVQGSSRGG